jgi:hypothetical protein
MVSTDRTYTEACCCISGDGNCLFRALFQFYSGERETENSHRDEGHLLMRNLIVDFVKNANLGDEEKDSFRAYHGVSVEEWTESMSNPGIYGITSTNAAILQRTLFDRLHFVSLSACC